jgi:hypothetical protein
LRNMNLAGVRALAIAAVLALTALPVMKATPVTWLVTGFTFTDGSTIAGGVTYDAATNTYSNDLILTTGGSTYNNVFFQYWNPSLPVSPSYITLVESLPTNDLTNDPSLWILLQSPITGPPGSVVPSLLAIEALCADPTCSTVQNATAAFSITGEVVAFAATGVPDPPAAMLLPAGILFLAGWKKARHRRGGTRG